MTKCSETNCNPSTNLQEIWNLFQNVNAARIVTGVSSKIVQKFAVWRSDVPMTK